MTTVGAPALHHTLARQLRRLGLPDGALPDAATWQRLIALVDHTYREADDERSTLQRSVTVSAQEVRGLHEVLSRQARQDPLTGLPNRAALLAHLEEVLADWRRDPHPVAVLFVDLDGFTLVNDSRGHAAGDELLVLAAGRLRSLLREEDLVARVGGDEFVVVCGGAHGSDNAHVVARRISRALAAPFPVAGQDVVVGASIGLATLDSPADTGEAVLRRADLAVYRAKTEGRGRTCVYDVGMQSAVDDQLSVQSALGAAVTAQELRVLYQPVVSLDDGRVLGAEALVRWERPGHGLVSPDRFIPVAEQSPLVTAVDCWVLAEACREAAGWAGGRGSIAVNASTRTLQSERLVPMLTWVLADTGLEPGRLSLEITETAVLSGSAEVDRTLERIRALGVRLSIDDFGTGYSSLARLSTTDVDVLKVDRSLVSEMDTDPATAAIVAAIVAMGRALGQTVVAEGVERAAQATVLRELGCHAGQGWLFGRPGPAAVIEEGCDPRRAGQAGLRG